MTQGYLQADLLTNAIADETTSPWADVRGRTGLVFYLDGLGTTSGGVITLEESLQRADGSWPATAVSITTVNASDISAGAQKLYRPSTLGAYGWVRARVSTAISGGGSVSVRLIAV